MQYRSLLSLLVVRPFGALFLSSMLTHLGIWTHMVAAGWMMTSLTTSKTMVALVQSSQALLVMGLALIAGIVADSFDRRSVLIVAQVFGIVVALTLAPMAFLNVASAGALLTLSCLVGAALALHLPAWQTSVSEFVGKENLPSAVSLNSIGVNLMRARRRIRLRDGARQWALLRDLESPERWTEKYLVSTWADYRRHNERRIQIDAKMYEQLCHLHRGLGRPPAKRHIQWSALPCFVELPPVISDFEGPRRSEA